MIRSALIVSTGAMVAFAFASCGAESNRTSQSIDAAGNAEGGETSGDARDGGPCGLFAYSPQLVCFGAGGSDYAKYLISDAGVGVGQCPAIGAFRSEPGEGTCGYSVCGPLPRTAIRPDAGLDGGSSCCFWVVSVCGV